MLVQRPPQVSPYLREKTRKITDVDQESDVEEGGPLGSFEKFLTSERRDNTANNGGRLLHGSTLYQLARESTYNPFIGDNLPCHRHYRKIHRKSMALTLAGVGAHNFDV